MSESLRGHPIEWDGKQYVFCDTKESTQSTWETRPCGHCGEFNTKEGHDGCLGTLPNVMNACCGHGQVRDCYVQYDDGRLLYGKDAQEAQSSLTKGAN